ncbi:hypothetical protein K504DRAFT_255637 [Pleomassaria siparia CBS 279.74]|uniref:DUF3074 domain-containing protein n=1 Tax=Pleomassaria siparia CBS 279.74 TaxID=1314801 RepID=A0A6G1KBS6_9PLEO|nr:hypothetical protein K504DRAFT_255637 [Pleomassaria siparia CBS 279.74]
MPSRVPPHGSTANEEQEERPRQTNRDPPNGTAQGAPESTWTPEKCPPRDDFFRKNKPLSSLGINEVPYHPDFGTETGAHPLIGDFCDKIFNEAKAWLVEEWSPTGTRLAKINDKQLNISEYKTKNHDRWYARLCEFKPEHDQNWYELDHVLRLNHSDHEDKYTPEIFDHKTLLKWNIDHRSEEAVQWEKRFGMRSITVELTEIYHHVNNWMKNRVFTVILLTGIRTNLDEIQVPPTMETTGQWMVIQLPVDLSTFPANIQERSNHSPSLIYQPHLPKTVDGQEVESNQQQKKTINKKLVEGRYASVEIVGHLVVRDGSSDAGPAKDHTRISWAMSTASDAGGHMSGPIPKFFYRWAVPKTIAKDIDLVCDYVKQNRGSEGWPSPRSGDVPVGLDH